jgi:hypothetical protein
VLLRFGFADGYHDAVNLRARSRWTRPVEGLRAGAELHTLEGIVRADVRRIDYDEASGRFEEEVRWHDSYEAEQHVHHYGKATAPVCWSLVGYSSGFASACLGKEIYHDVKAEDAPTAVERLLKAYIANRASTDETFLAFSRRHDGESLRQMAEAESRT